MDQEISALIALLGDAQYDAYKLAAKKLRRLGHSAAPALREQLSTSNPVTVIRAVRLLGQIGDTSAIATLRQLSTEGFPDLASARETALRQLERSVVTDETARKAVAEVHAAQAIRRAREGTDTWKAPVPEIASEIKKPGSGVSANRRAALTLPTEIDALVATLGRPDYGRRVAATEALIARGSEAVPALVRVLANPSILVRVRAYEALGRIGDDAALPAITRALLNEATEQGRSAGAAAVLKFADGLVERVRPALLPSYIDLVAIYRSPIHDWIPVPISSEAARCLEILAKSAPGPELRRALTHLKGVRPFIPAEFAQARQAIEEATAAWSALPVPASVPESPVENLPTPAEPEPVVAGELPMPAPVETNAPETTDAVKKKQRRPELPRDPEGLIAFLGSPETESSRLAEGRLMLDFDLALPALLRAFPDASETTKRAIVRILCGNPTEPTWPTLENARTLFPDDPTLRRTMEKLRK